MACTYTIVEAVTAAGRTITKENSYTENAQNGISEPIPDQSTDLEVDFVLDVSAIKAIVIVSDQDITLETNNGTTPDDTINLVAGVPYIWTDKSYHACLLTTDVTALFITNSSGSAATRALESWLNSWRCPTKKSRRSARFRRKPPRSIPPWMIRM